MDTRLRGYDELTGLAKVLRKAVSVPLLNIGWATMQRYELADIEAAFENYISDPRTFAPSVRPEPVEGHSSAKTGFDKLTPNGF